MHRVVPAVILSAVFALRFSWCVITFFWFVVFVCEEIIFLESGSGHRKAFFQGCGILRLPVRRTVTAAKLLARPRLAALLPSWVLNCQPHDVPVLVGAKLLKPLGNPPTNSVKFFATLELLELVKDKSWLAKMTNVLNQHWQKKNAAKKNVPAKGSQNAHASVLNSVAA